MALPELQVAKTLSDAWDYKGQPAHRATTGGWISAAMILGSSPFLSYSVSMSFIINSVDIVSKHHSWFPAPFLCFYDYD